MFRLASRLALSVALCTAFALAAQAQLVDATHTVTKTISGNGLSASAVFSVDANGCLDIVLTNTATSLSSNASPSQVLTGLFFDVAGNPSFTDNSLTFSSGSSYVNGTSAETPGQHWGYAEGISGSNPFNANYGFATAGLGIFGDSTAFESGGSNPVVDGVDYGLVGNASATPGGPGTPKPQIFNGVETVLCESNGSGSGSYTIENVNFQYGTAFGETTIPTPPAALVMMAGGGLAWLRLLRPRLRRKS